MEDERQEVAANADLSTLAITLLKGVIYREGDERLWGALLDLQARASFLRPLVAACCLPRDDFVRVFVHDRLERVTAQLQIRDQFRKTLLQRVRFNQLAQRHLRPILQRLADMTRELRTVNHHLRIQRRSVQIDVARLERNIRDNRLLHGRVQRTLHRKLDVG